MMRALSFPLVCCLLQSILSLGLRDAQDPNQPVSPSSAITGPPVFLEEPEDSYYVLRNRAALVTCKAAPARRISFKCVSQWVPRRDVETIERVDPETNTKYLQASLFVSRGDMEEYFGMESYWCECTAWSKLPNPTSVTSKRGYIYLAYQRRRFNREPISTRVELGERAQFQCLPPDGKPAPEVMWFKDGKQINTTTTQSLFILNGSNLVITEARLSDMGFYTCVAQNVAARRLSEHARLTVYATTTPSPAPDYNNIAGYTHRTGDCPGNDITKMEGTVVEDCARTCDESMRCRSFVFNSRGSYCWLKNSDCPSLGFTGTQNYHFYNKVVTTTPTPATDYNSIAGYTHRTGDCAGNDITKIEETVVEDCARACDESLRCRSFLFNARGSYCWLKYSDCPSLGFTGTQNYHFYNKVVTTTPTPATDYYDIEGYTHRTGDCAGNDITKMEGTVVEDCARACDESVRCRSFLFNARGSYCWLKDSDCPSLGYKSAQNYHFYNKIASSPTPLPTSPETSATKPRNLQVKIVFPDPIVAMVSWDAPPTSSHVLSYQVSYGKKDSPIINSWQVHGTRMFYAPFLEDGVTYEYKVAANFGVKFGESASISQVASTNEN